jgi:antitoxin (DNA-binding transcriptional repressor) of toxin-antitoxin stability system
MKTVNIATLKDQLSAYLQEVRAGTEILVRDRNRVIARIVPFTPAAEDDELEALAAEGKLRPAEGRSGTTSGSCRPRASLPRR